MSARNHSPPWQQQGLDRKQFIETCTAELSATGVCVIQRFLPDDATAASLANALAALPHAHPVDHEFEYDDVYGNPAGIDRASLPANHPRNTRSLTRIRFIARDLIAADDPVLGLHRSPWMSAFIAEVMQIPTAVPSPCPLSGCIFTVAEAGELQDWHFDSNDFIVTLMLQAPYEGGQFEYVQGLRDAEGEDDFDGVRAAFAGTHPDTQRLHLRPGDLTLFKGRYNFHRAVPVAGGQPRVMAILSFDPRPDYVARPEHLRLFYGRSEALPASD